jgi:hypothetical protein
MGPGAETIRLGAAIPKVQSRGLDPVQGPRLYIALRPVGAFFLGAPGCPPARWQSGYAEDCKSSYIGSIPVRASKYKTPKSMV